MWSCSAAPSDDYEEYQEEVPRLTPQQQRAIAARKAADRQHSNSWLPRPVPSALLEEPLSAPPVAMNRTPSMAERFNRARIQDDRRHPSLVRESEATDGMPPPMTTMTPVTRAPSTLADPYAVNFTRYVEHTWTKPGPLGLKLQPRSGEAFRERGVFVRMVTDLKGLPEYIHEDLVVVECNGQKGLQNSSYDTVIDLIRNAGRPCTLVFGELPTGAQPRVVPTNVDGPPIGAPPMGAGVVGANCSPDAYSEAHINHWAGMRDSVTEEAIAVLEESPPPVYSPGRHRLQWEVKKALAHPLVRTESEKRQTILHEESRGKHVHWLHAMSQARKAGATWVPHTQLQAQPAPKPPRQFHRVPSVHV